VLDVDNYRLEELKNKEYGTDGLLEGWKTEIEGVFAPVGI
jgi:hypothetical protein